MAGSIYRRSRIRSITCDSAFSSHKRYSVVVSSPNPILSHVYLVPHFVSFNSSLPEFQKKLFSWSNDSGMQLGLRRTTRCAAVSATAEAYGLRWRIETYASSRIKMVGGAPWGGSHPRHNAGQREQRLSVRACGSPRWAGGVETSCGSRRGWRPRRCWDPGDRCANRGRASGWDPSWPRPPPRSPLRSAASASPSTSPTSPPLPSSGPSRTTSAGGCHVLLHVRPTSVLYGIDWGSIPVFVDEDPNPDIAEGAA